MVNMADVEKTKSDAADLLYSDDVKKDSHGKMDNADVGNDHHVVSILKFLNVAPSNQYLFPSISNHYINEMFYSWNFRRENMS